MLFQPVQISHFVGLEICLVKPFVFDHEGNLLLDGLVAGRENLSQETAYFPLLVQRDQFRGGALPLDLGEVTDRIADDGELAGKG